jgi:hypothetical protein
MTRQPDSGAGGGARTRDSYLGKVRLSVWGDLSDDRSSRARKTPTLGALERRRNEVESKWRSRGRWRSGVPGLLQSMHANSMTQMLGM